MLYQVDTGSGLIGIKYINADSEPEAIEKAKDILFDKELRSNCCGANDIYDGNLGNNEGVCADCGEHCEMEEV
jgi:hypothetical protein